MAIGDYITCCKCGCKLIYDGDRSQRDWWQERWGTEPQIECPDCKQPEQRDVTARENAVPRRAALRGARVVAQPEQTVSVDEYKRLQKLVTNQGIRLMEYESEQPEQEPVANGLPLVIAGAIFDFAGYLTTRDTVIEVGSTANASPVADLVKDWATLRGLSLADAAVLSWQEWLTDVRANDTSKERVDEMQKQRHDTTPPQPASKPWVGLTDEVDELAREMVKGDKSVNWLARAIEAKLREKNHA